MNQPENGNDVVDMLAEAARVDALLQSTPLASFIAVAVAQIAAAQPQPAFPKATSSDNAKR